MRSVRVVLPASICAAMPMLRVRSSGKARFGEFRLVTDSVVAAIVLFLVERDGKIRFLCPRGQWRIR